MEIPNYYSNDQTNPFVQNRYHRPHDPCTLIGQNCEELKQSEYFLKIHYPCPQDPDTPVRQNSDPILQRQYSTPQDPNTPVRHNGGGVNQTGSFEPGLSSMASSPTEGYTSNDGESIKELIGRLGNICDDDQLSPQSCIVPNNLITSPPYLDLSSHVKLPNYPPNLSQFIGNVDHAGFAETTAIFNSLVHRTPTPRSDRMVPENGDSREGSSLSDQNKVGQSQKGGNSKKRKLVSLVNVIEKVEVENEESNAKRSKQEDEKEDKKQNVGVKKSDANNANNSNKGKQKSNNNNIAKAEPPKDYIHVRARRGQATDSHSLAERVRREKISERMRFLQDLVPGCNKVTGKATVLEEIINYVQSLQCQVEFLSMKLANVNPRMDINLEALLTNDLFQSRGAGISQIVYPAYPAFSLGYPSSQRLSVPLPNGNDNNFSNPLNAAGMWRNPSIQWPSMDGFVDPLTQVSSFWDNDLQSIVQNQTQIVPGNSSLSEMKVEL